MVSWLSGSAARRPRDATVVTGASQRRLATSCGNFGCRSLWPAGSGLDRRPVWRPDEVTSVAPRERGKAEPVEALTTSRTFGSGTANGRTDRGREPAMAAPDTTDASASAGWGAAPSPRRCAAARRSNGPRSGRATNAAARVARPAPDPPRHQHPFLYRRRRKGRRVQGCSRDTPVPPTTVSLLTRSMDGPAQGSTADRRRTA